jgi:hypothetical protein
MVGSQLIAQLITLYLTTVIYICLDALQKRFGQIRFPWQKGSAQSVAGPAPVRGLLPE